MRFCQADVLADPALRIKQLNGGAARLRVTASPARAKAGRALRRVRVLVTFGTAKSRTPVPGATVTIAGRKLKTAKNGRASTRVRLTRRGRYGVRASRRILGRAVAVVRTR